MKRLPFEFDGVVRLTRLGGTYVLFTILIGFSALNTGNNALYIGLSFMLGGLLLSGISSKTGLSGISVTIEGLDETWAGARSAAVLKVYNGSRVFPVRDLIIVAPELDRPAYVERLGRRKTTTVHADFRFERRGKAAVEYLELYTRYPFALFLKKRRVAASGETIVFPRLIDGVVLDPRLGEKSGDLSPQQRLGIGPELFALREYSQGDSVRQVHWKKSASLGRMVTIQSAAETSRIVRVFIDPALPPGRSAEDFERLISHATTYIHDLLGAGCEIVLDTPGSTQRATGLDGSRPIFETLALLESKPPTRGETAFRGDGVVFSLRSAA